MRSFVGANRLQTGRAQSKKSRYSKTAALAVAVGGVASLLGQAAFAANGADTWAGNGANANFSTGANSLPLTIPSGATAGAIYSRFRCSTTSNLTPTGQASDVQLQAESRTEMTNVGGGAVGPLWLCLLAFVVVVLPGRRRDHVHLRD